jgi:hypothetical protein
METRLTQNHTASWCVTLRHFGPRRLYGLSVAPPFWIGLSQPQEHHSQLQMRPAYVHAWPHGVGRRWHATSSRLGHCVGQRQRVFGSQRFSSGSRAHPRTKQRQWLEVLMPSIQPVMRMKGTKNRAFYDDDDENDLIWDQQDEAWWSVSNTAMNSGGSVGSESAYPEQSAMSFDNARSSTENARNNTTNADDNQLSIADISESLPEEEPGQESSTRPHNTESSIPGQSKESLVQSSSLSKEGIQGTSPSSDSEEYLGPFVDPSASYIQCPECAMCYEIDASLLAHARICRCTFCLHEFLASTADLISADTLVSDRPTMGARPLPRADAIARAEARLRPARDVVAEALAAEAANTSEMDGNAIPLASEYADIMLYVGNLAPAVSESDLVAAFSPYGDLMSCRIIRDRQRGHSLGYGFVRFTCREDARLALDQLQGTCLMGQDISIGYARNPNPRESEETRHAPDQRPSQIQTRRPPYSRSQADVDVPDLTDNAATRHRPAASPSALRVRSELLPRKPASSHNRPMDRHPGMPAPGREDRLDDGHYSEQEEN